jgi:hypothetical protein
MFYHTRECGVVTFGIQNINLLSLWPVKISYFTRLSYHMKVEEQMLMRKLYEVMCAEGLLGKVFSNF